jgi:multimeric flavodoxin WrbA
MKLTIVNGSPKNGISNTGILCERFAAGCTSIEGNECESYRLNHLSAAEAAGLLYKNEYTLLAFPLYVYFIPSTLKEFIESIQANADCRVKIGFLVQYGFPEAVHARPLEIYLENLAAMLNCGYLGTIIKGGCDKLSQTPAEDNEKILNGAYEIGKKFGETGLFDPRLLAAYSMPETISEEMAKHIMINANTHYWEKRLRENGAYERYRDRPLIEASPPAASP